MSNLKFIKYLCIILICLSCFSCAMIPHFSPSSQPMEFYQKEKEIHIEGSVAPSYRLMQLTQLPWNLDGYLGYSITNNLFVDFRTTLNKINVNNNEEDINKRGDDNYNIQRVNYGLGLGYYKWITNFIFGAKAGLFLGKTDLKANQYMNFYDNNLAPLTYFNKDFKTNNLIINFCPFIGFENEYTQLGFQLNFQRERIYNIENNLYGLYYKNEIENLKPFSLISKSYTDWAIEPSIILKGGFKNIKFVFQEIFSHRYSNSNIAYLKGNTYFGIELNFNIDEIINKNK